MKEKMSQKKYILAHLKRYGFIEPLTALREYGIYRLGSRINDLRNEGVNIRTDFVQTKSRVTGNMVRFAKYVLL